MIICKENMYLILRTMLNILMMSHSNHYTVGNISHPVFILFPLFCFWTKY